MARLAGTACNATTITRESRMSNQSPVVLEQDHGGEGRPEPGCDAESLPNGVQQQNSRREDEIHAAAQDPPHQESPPRTAIEVKETEDSRRELGDTRYSDRFEPSDQTRRFEHIPKELIDPDPEQVRSRIDVESEEFRGLCETIARHGLIQPIEVRPGEKEGHYTVVAGGRRLQAAMMIRKIDKVPCVIIEEGIDRFQAALSPDRGKRSAR